MTDINIKWEAVTDYKHSNQRLLVNSNNKNHYLLWSYDTIVLEIENGKELRNEYSKISSTTSKHISQAKAYIDSLELGECYQCHKQIPYKDLISVCVYHGNYYEPPEYDDICKACNKIQEDKEAEYYKQEQKEYDD